MPQIVKINDFTKSDTTENTYAKFQKVYVKKSYKLEDINKNGYIQLEYDINDSPYLEIKSNKQNSILTNNSIKTNSGHFNNITLKKKDLETILKTFDMKVKYLEERVRVLEEEKNIIETNVNEDPEDILYLIEFKNPSIGKYGLFTLNDNNKYLYICYNIDKNISYWKTINNVEC